MKNKCKHCNKQTTNPKFCSKSCSAKFNNIINPKRKRVKTGICKTCGIEVYNKRIRCIDCYNQNLQEKSIMNKVLSDSLTDGQKQNLYGNIRFHARKIANVLPHACFKCGYDKHVEVCHIKSISSFSLETKVSVINDISNLVKLCRNCHWELDNNLLNL